MSGSNVDGSERIVTRGLEAGAAMYALDHATRGTPIGAEGNLAEQATRTAGNFVIAAILWHVVIVPYLVVTAVIFAIPTIVAAAVIGNDHVMSHDWPVVALLLVASFCTWVRYALYKGLWRRFVRPIDAGLSGRRLDDPARQPETLFRESPTQFVASHSNEKGAGS